jgi:hypothetical protein
VAPTGAISTPNADEDDEELMALEAMMAWKKVYNFCGDPQSDKGMRYHTLNMFSAKSLFKLVEC